MVILQYGTLVLSVVAYVICSVLYGNPNLYSPWTISISNVSNENNMERKFKDNSKYIWEPHYKYNQLCDIIQGRLNGSKTNELYYRVEYGGFGNQMYSITSVLLLGVLSDHQAIFDYPQYRKFLSGCYSNNIMSMDQNLGEITRCKPYTICFPTKNSSWTIDPVVNQNVVLSYSLMDSTKFLDNIDNGAILTSLFKDAIPDFSLWNVRRDIMRLWLNPSDSLRDEILAEKETLVTRPHLIGLNLRMGGTYAVVQESYVGIPPSRLPSIATQIHTFIQSRNWNYSDVEVYISSDSTKAITRMRQLLNQDIVIAESQLYIHGHTKTSFNSDDHVNKMKKIVADMYYMAISEHRFVSWQSSFGRIICFLSDENTCDAVLNWKNTNKNIQIPK